MSARPIDTPPAADPFLVGIRERELRMQQCSACGYIRHPARWICPECLGEDFTWTRLSGRGEIETFVWYLRHLEPVPPEAARRSLPYNVALVQLAEGPRLFANVTGVAFGELQIGDAVTASFAQTPDAGVALEFVLEPATPGGQRT